MDYEKYREEFESSLDENGEINIGQNFSALPSQILYEMDQLAYEEQLAEFSDQKKAEFNQLVYQNFPAPIAYFYRQTEHGYDDDNHRLQLVRSTWESAIYVLYALVLGELNYRRFSLADIRIFDNTKIKNTRSGLLSDRLGYKIEAMQKIIEFDRVNNNDLLVSTYLSNDIFEVLKELNHERNSFSHIAALSRPEARERFLELYPKVSDLLYELAFLERVYLLRFFNAEGGMNKLRFNKYSDHSLQKQNYNRTLSNEELSSFTPILSDSFILIELDGEIFNVSPFIHFQIEGQDIKLAYYKKIDTDNPDEYVFELIGATDREIRIPKDSLSNCIDQTLDALT